MKIPDYCEFRFKNKKDFKKALIKNGSVKLTGIQKITQRSWRYKSWIRFYFYANFGIHLCNEWDKI